MKLAPKTAALLLSMFLLNAAVAEPANHSEILNRQQLVERHNPIITTLDAHNPLTVGNGQLAFTVDVTGLQSFPERYYQQGIPLETKARWAWHSRPNPDNFSLADAGETYSAYGREVRFPTNMDSEAGQWLRQNPHDLPLARLSFELDGKSLQPQQLQKVQQTLDLWRGLIISRYELDGRPVTVNTLVDGSRDLIAVAVDSPLLASGRLSLKLAFPRGYRLDKKNTPDLDWQHPLQHDTRLRMAKKNRAEFLRQVDDHQHKVLLNWRGHLQLKPKGAHRYQLAGKSTADTPKNNRLFLSLEFIADGSDSAPAADWQQSRESAARFWQNYWQQGAMVSLTGSKHPGADELERRIILSQYLLAVQGQADIPAQETGLTSSSWYGKHHTEMSWWHTAHWIFWNRPRQAERVLQWYVQQLPAAQQLAQERGLEGARWAKMVGPDGRESPGGNPLIIWNQPQPIHLAEMLYQRQPSAAILKRYDTLVEQTARALSSMLVWEEKTQRYSLLPPIWIAQEIYDPALTRNPTFELSYWRYGLGVAQMWRLRQGKEANPLWQKQLQQLAPLPVKDGRYVAIESVPDTFDNIASRQDHPTMLAPMGLLSDPTVDREIMQSTFAAVMTGWDWEEKIWGWDYPMIAMTALKLGDTGAALEWLLKGAPHNHYLTNGHCPQPGASLPVYLPANGALLSAMAMIVDAWAQQPASGWQLTAEGFGGQQVE